MEPEDSNHCTCIPSGICTHVFSYLSVKSLLHFRSVSKEWKSMIDNPDFASFHLSRYPNNSLESCLLVLERENTSERSVLKARLFNCCSTAIEDYRQILEFDPPVELEGIQRCSSWPAIVGDADGLLLVQKKSDTWIQGDVFLWNPSIRKIFNVPLPPSMLLSSPVRYCVDLCFGFDPSTNDYKVVNIIHSPETTMQCEIFSLKSTSWRSVSCSNHNDRVNPLSSWCQKVYSSGSVHWVAYGEVLESCDDDLYYANLVSFNMITETFSYNLLPYGSYEMEIPVVLDGSSIGLVTSNRDNIFRANIDIWVLQEDMRWSKRYALGPHFQLTGSTPFYIKNDGVLISAWSMIGAGLYAYDMSTKKKFVLSKIDEVWTFYIGRYVESLVLLS